MSYDLAPKCVCGEKWRFPVNDGLEAINGVFALFSHQASGFLCCVHIVTCEAFQKTVLTGSCWQTPAWKASKTPPRQKACRAWGWPIWEPVLYVTPWRTENWWVALSRQWETSTVEARLLLSFLSASPSQGSSPGAPRTLLTVPLPSLLAVFHRLTSSWERGGKEGCERIENSSLPQK